MPAGIRASGYGGSYADTVTTYITVHIVEYDCPDTPACSATSDNSYCMFESPPVTLTCVDEDGDTVTAEACYAATYDGYQDIPGGGC